MSFIKNNRAASFGVLFVIYTLAAVLGVWVYSLLDLSVWLGLLIADMAATVFVFIFSLIFSNASVYDPYWSVQPPVILAAFMAVRGAGIFGILLLAVISLWAVRLTANWAYTFGGLSHQDWRYTMLCEKTGAFYPLINFIGIHTVPTLVVYGCTLPAVYAVVYGYEANIYSVIVLSVSLFAIALQGTADVQMHKYRRARNSPFIRTGLWKYSRHPNYLGEILMWWGVGASVVIAEPSAWYLLAGAVANTALFMFVSIPLADGRQSKKAGFEEYKRATRMLLPIKKR